MDFSPKLTENSRHILTTVLTIFAPSGKICLTLLELSHNTRPLYTYYLLTKDCSTEESSRKKKHIAKRMCACCGQGTHQIVYSKQAHAMH